MNKTELTKIKEMVKDQNYGALNAYLKEIEYNLSLEELNSNTSKKRLNAIKKYLNKNLKTERPILSKCNYQNINVYLYSTSFYPALCADERSWPCYFCR